MPVTFGRVAARAFACIVMVMSIAACAGPRDETRVLTADMPLHLEDHPDAATLDALVTRPGRGDALAKTLS